MRFFWLAIIIVAITAILPPESVYAQGLIGISNKKKLTELKSLSKIIEENPNDIGAFFKYAKLSSSAGRFKDAEKAYLHMLQVNPNLNRVKTALAIVYIKMGNTAKAESLFKQVLDDNPPPFIKNKIEKTLIAINKNASSTSNSEVKTSGNEDDYTREQFLKDVKNRTSQNKRLGSFRQKLLGENPKTEKLGTEGKKSNKRLIREVRKRTNPENRPVNKKRKKAEKEEKLKKLTPEQRKAHKELSILKQKIAETPNNLDAYFSLAKLAEKLGEPETAEDAYKHMLDKQPKLGRVKLDLGLLYVKTGKFKQAKSLFEEVLKEDPPEKVKENINNILSQVNQAMKKHIISGSVSFGINRDSNATSAASTGETTFSDISIPLAENSTAKEDAQWFGTTSLSHIYKFDNNNSKIWSATYNTTGTLYKTSQTTEHQLDIGLASLKTGPFLNLNRLKTQIGIQGGISIINLNSFKYLKTRSGHFSVKYAPTNKLIFDNTATYEYRYFYNSPTAINTGRTGNAYQDKLGVTYILTDKDILTSSITWRNESAREAKNAFDQINFSLGYTRQLPYDIAANALATFKSTHYDDFDTTISSTILRRDLEKTLTLTLAKRLRENITLTTSYQYKNANSNIQNFTYDNHRVSGAIGWSF
jgi:tetratricopeptide (TPR) repeat protein